MNSSKINRVQCLECAARFQQQQIFKQKLNKTTKCKYPINSIVNTALSHPIITPASSNNCCL